MKYMKLEKFIDRYRRELIRPADSIYMPLFMHCSNGSIAVTTSEYEKVVEPLLKLHEVSVFEVDDLRNLYF